MGGKWEAQITPIEDIKDDEAGDSSSGGARENGAPAKRVEFDARTQKYAEVGRAGGDGGPGATANMSGLMIRDIVNGQMLDSTSGTDGAPPDGEARANFARATQ